MRGMKRLIVFQENKDAVDKAASLFYIGAPKNHEVFCGGIYRDF
jgi:hypothetical protein